MNTRSLGILGAAMAAALAAGASPASAQAMAFTEWGTISVIGTAWNDDALAVYHTAPMVNPGGCPNTTTGYATDPGNPGRDLFHSIIVTAVLNHRDVLFLISGCVYDKPRIISVSLR